MKNIFKYLLSIALLLIFVALIFFSLSKVKLHPALYSFLPDNKKMKKSAILSSKSFNADKVIFFIEVTDENKLKEAVDKCDEIILNSKVQMSNALPTANDVKEVISYAEENALLLYPYEHKENPFTKEETGSRVQKKSDYFLSMPFFSPDKSFFSDPLMLSTEILLNASEFSKGKYTVKYNGVIAENKRSYLRILKAGFFPDNYVKDKEIKKIDDQLVEFGKKINAKVFLVSAHLFYLESNSAIQTDVLLVFILTTILTLFIFIYFIRNISFLFFSLIPIVGGFALTFFAISFFKNEFSAIVFGFGSTSIGIAIDYSIQYLLMKDLYKDVKMVRKKIGFSLILGFITTIFAFVFLPFSKIESLKDIAFFGAVSVSASFLLTWFFLQKILPPEKSKSSNKKIELRCFEIKYLYIWLGILIAASFALPFIKFEDNLMNLDMKHKELNQRLAEIQKNFNESTDNIFLAFSGKTRDEALNKSLNALFELKKDSKDLSFFTPSLLFPSSELIEKRKIFIRDNFKKNILISSLNNSIFEAESFNDFLIKINNIKKLEISNLPAYIEHQISSMFVNYEDREYLLIPVYKRENALKLESALKDKKIDFEIIDLVKDSAAGLSAFEKHGIFLLLLSIILIYLILLVIYRNFKYAFTAVLPAIASLILSFSLTVILHNNFNIMHFVACILLVGIGVDYGVFITNILIGKYNDKEIKLTMKSTFICALTTIAGFGVLAFCRHNTLFSLGITMLFGISYAFATAYLAIPFILGKMPKK